MPISLHDICNLLESVELLSKPQSKLNAEQQKEGIRQVVSNWFIHHREEIDHPDTNGDATLSTLLPHRRKDRVYGLQAPALSKKITKLLNFSHQRLDLFNDWASGTQGDLGVYTERAMKSWDGTFTIKPVVPIDRVDKLLTQLAAKYRFSDPWIRRKRNWEYNTDEELKEIFKQIESWEAKWFVRMILRSHCTIDLDEWHLLSQYHFLLPDLLMFQNDFEAAIALLRGGLSSYPPNPDPALENYMRIQAAEHLKPVIGVKIGRPRFYKAWSFNNCFQLVGDRAWAAETKYDGEYCEIHVDLGNSKGNIKIFSKNGKDATADRHALHSTIVDALRIRSAGCMFKQRCIVLGEMVLWSDREQKVLPFSKIRKHIARSGSFLGTLQDSAPHEWEHLMLVFFDVLLVDDDPVLRWCLQDRRAILRELVQAIPGRSMRSEWTLLDFKTDDGQADLKQTFARTLAERQEGLVLKPLHSPYFPLLSDLGHQHTGYYIKFKKDYLGDMGGQRDLGDFVIIGASFNPQTAPKTDVKTLHWTHFHLGCLMNKSNVERRGAKPKFKVMGCISVDKQIQKSDLKYLNNHGYLYQVPLGKNTSIQNFDIEPSSGFGPRMTVAFKRPFIAEILGGGYERVQNETFEMLRHLRIQKLHHDRTWKDAVTAQQLGRMASEKWELPDADKLDGHAKEVALLAEKYAREMRGSQSQFTASELELAQDSTQETTQRTSLRTTQESVRHTAPSPCNTQESAQNTTFDAVIVETQQSVSQSQNSYTTASTTQYISSSEGIRIHSPREFQVLGREDFAKRIPQVLADEPVQLAGTLFLTPPISSAEEKEALPTPKKRKGSMALVSPPPLKRTKWRSPLQDIGKTGTTVNIECDEQARIIRVYPKAGWMVEVYEEEGGMESE